MNEPIINRPESIRQRLRDRMRAKGEDAQFGLQRYAIERFLFRLGRSRHRDRFILKGAALFAIWGGTAYRATRDLDFTKYGSFAKVDVLADIRDICEAPIDGEEMVFIPESLKAEDIREESEYQGLRIHLQAILGESEIPIQIDIGFANAIEPPPTEEEYPTLLGDPAPRIRSYPLEAVVAEKFHAMVVLGERNSRYKDFYDLYVISGQFSFHGDRLGRAIQATFARRRTSIGLEIPSPLQPRFFSEESRNEQWRAYLHRASLPNAPTDFALVGEQIRKFIGPVWNTLVQGSEINGTWEPGGPWK